MVLVRRLVEHLQHAHRFDHPSRIFGVPVWANERDRDVSAAEFNVINSSKQMCSGPGPIPQLNVFNFCAGDHLVALAQAANQRLRGHALVHRGRNPQWVDNGDFFREELIEILRNHIHTTVGHFKGKVALWDVVSEALTRLLAEPLLTEAQ